MAIKPPAELLSCAERPQLPEAPVTRSADLDYRIGMENAYADCKAKVDATANWAKTLTELRDARLKQRLN